MKSDLMSMSLEELLLLYDDIPLELFFNYLYLFV